MNKKSNFLVYILLAVAVLVLSVSTTLAYLMDTDKGESIMKFGKVSIYADGKGSSEAGKENVKSMLHAELVNDSFAGDDIVVNEENKLQFAATGDSADFYAKVRFTYRASTEESTELYKEELADLTNKGVPAGMKLFGGAEAGYKYYTHTDGWSYLVVDDGDETTIDKKLKVVSGDEVYVITQEYTLKYGLYATETAVIEMFRALEELGQDIELVCEVKAIQAEGAKVAEEILSAGEDKEADYGNASIYDFVRIELENDGIVNEVAELEQAPENVEVVATPKLAGNRMVVKGLAAGEGFGFKYKVTNPVEGKLARLAVICEEGAVENLAITLDGEEAMVSEYAEGDHEVEVVVKANADLAEGVALIFAIDAIDADAVRNSNVTPETLEEMIANAVKGDTIVLTEGDYGDVTLSKFPENLTIVGAEGAKIGKMTITRGVTTIENDTLPAGLTLKNLKITKGLFVINGNIKGLTVIGCEFEDGANISVRPYALGGKVTADKKVAALWAVTDLTIEDCKFTGGAVGQTNELGTERTAIYLQHIEGTTIVRNNVIEGAAHNFIQVSRFANYASSGIAHENKGNLIIEGNKVSNVGSRFIRICNYALDSIVIKNNEMSVANLNPKEASNGDNVIKISPMAGVLTFEGNTVDGEEVKVAYLEDAPVYVDLGKNVATPETVQTVISAAKAGDIVLLAPGEYAKIAMKKTFAENLTIVGTEGAKVAGLVVKSGVNNLTITKLPAGLTLKNITFTDRVYFMSGNYEKVSVIGCKFVDGATLEFPVWSMEGGPSTEAKKAAALWTVKDLTIEGCEFTNAESSAILIYNIVGTTTIKNNKVIGAGHNAINIVRYTGYGKVGIQHKNEGTLIIEGNEFQNTASRFLRMILENMTAVQINNNKMYNANTNDAEKTENGENVIKITGMPTTDILTFEGNTVDEQPVVNGSADTELVYIGA